MRPAAARKAQKQAEHQYEQYRQIDQRPEGRTRCGVIDAVKCRRHEERRQNIGVLEGALGAAVEGEGVRIGAEQVEIACNAGECREQGGKDPSVHQRGQRALPVAVDETRDEQRYGHQKAGDLNVTNGALIVLRRARLARADQAEQQESTEQKNQEHQAFGHSQSEEHGEREQGDESEIERRRFPDHKEARRHQEPETSDDQTVAISPPTGPGCRT